MKKVTIGKSNVEVPVIGLGTNAVGGHNLYPNLDENVGKELVRTSIDHGINFLDTAYAYGQGRSEELIGQVVQEFKREDIIIATKAAHIPNGKGYDNSPAFIEKAIEAAMSRLQTDYIDIFYLHYPDKTTPKREILSFLNECKKQGKIRAIGVSNFSLAELQEANQDGYVDVVQDEYNLIARQNEETLMSYCLEKNISFIPFFPLASGLLTGKYTEKACFPKGDLRNSQPNFQGKRLKEIVQKVDQLEPIAMKHNVEIYHVVLNWYLQRPTITAIIPGAKNKEQLIENIRATSFSLSADEMQSIDTLFHQ